METVQRLEQRLEHLELWEAEEAGGIPPHGACRERGPAHTLISDSWPPEGERIDFCYLNTPSLWDFVTADPGAEYSSQGVREPVPGASAFQHFQPDLRIGRGSRCTHGWLPGSSQCRGKVSAPHKPLLLSCLEDDQGLSWRVRGWCPEQGRVDGELGEQDWGGVDMGEGRLPSFSCAQ